MADADTTDEAAAGGGSAVAPAAKSSSMLSVIVEMIFLTCFAIGAGGLFGMMVLGSLGKPGAKLEPATVAAHTAKGKPAEPANLKPLPAVVTNLASPARTWIRLEAMMILAEGADGNALAAAIAEDMVAFLRTVPATQLEGPSGFLHLREDLNDRARIRSGGKVRELVVQSLVLE